MEKFSLRRFIKRPVDISILESWAKMCDDLAKTAILGIFGSMFFADEFGIFFKIFSFIGLLGAFVILMLSSIHFRQLIVEHKEK